MNATITRDVITDLLPAYLSGEVSADTRTLLENFLKTDPEFAAQIKQQSKLVFAASAAQLTADSVEVKALKRAKRLIRRRAWLMGWAIFFTCFSISFQFGPDGFHWTMLEMPIVGVFSVALGLFFWIAYFRSKYRLKPTGI
jgi:anti-sigma factor RsiW